MRTYSTSSTPVDETGATDKQQAFIMRLANDRLVKEAVRSSIVDRLSYGPMPTKAEASRMIDWLLAQPKTSRDVAREQAAPVEPGMYETEHGVVYKVYPARMSDRMFAKELTADGFVYRGLATRFVSAKDRMTLEQAAAYGRTFGHCVVCGRLLTDPESIAAGIGPVCRERF